MARIFPWQRRACSLPVRNMTPFSVQVRFMGAVAPCKHLTQGAFMNRLFSTKSLIASAIALGAVAAGTAAHARTDVAVAVDLNSPHGYVQPAPVFVQHQ